MIVCQMQTIYKTQSLQDHNYELWYCWKFSATYFASILLSKWDSIINLLPSSPKLVWNRYFLM